MQSLRQLYGFLALAGAVLVVAVGVTTCLRLVSAPSDMAVLAAPFALVLTAWAALQLGRIGRRLLSSKPGNGGTPDGLV